MADIKLYYFESPGRAEPVRLAFAIGRVNFEDVRLTAQEWAVMKPTTPTGQLPMITVDGVQYVESTAILIYAASLVGLWPTDPVELMQTMQVVQFCDEFWKLLLGIYNKPQAEQGAAMRETVANDVPKFMETLEEMVETKGPEAQLDMSDLVLLNVLNFFDKKYFGFNAGDVSGKWPNIRARAQKVMNHPEVQAYYSRRN